MTILLAIWKLVGWRGLLVAVVIAAGAAWHLKSVSDAYARGSQAVRIEWAESNRRAELKAIERQQKQQGEIAKVEAELLTTQTQAAMRRRALETALESERADESKPIVDRSVCRLPKRVHDALRY